MTDNTRTDCARMFCPPGIPHRPHLQAPPLAAEHPRTICPRIISHPRHHSSHQPQACLLDPQEETQSQPDLSSQTGECGDIFQLSEDQLEEHIVRRLAQPHEHSLWPGHLPVRSHDLHHHLPLPHLHAAPGRWSGPRPLPPPDHLGPDHPHLQPPQVVPLPVHLQPVQGSLPRPPALVSPRHPLLLYHRPPANICPHPMVGSFCWICRNRIWRRFHSWSSDPCNTRGLEHLCFSYHLWSLIAFAAPRSSSYLVTFTKPETRNRDIQ